MFLLFAVWHSWHWNMDSKLQFFPSKTFFEWFCCQLCYFPISWSASITNQISIHVNLSNIWNTKVLHQSPEKMLLLGDFQWESFFLINALELEQIQNHFLTAADAIRKYFMPSIAWSFITDAVSERERVILTQILPFSSHMVAKWCFLQATLIYQWFSWFPIYGRHQSLALLVMFWVN